MRTMTRTGYTLAHRVQLHGDLLPEWQRSTASENGSHTLTPGTPRRRGWMTTVGDGQRQYGRHLDGQRNRRSNLGVSNNGVVPSGYYNIAVSYGPYCLTANGSDPNSSVNLQACNGSPASHGKSPAARQLPAPPSHQQRTVPGCLLRRNRDGTPVLAYTCTGTTTRAGRSTEERTCSVNSAPSPLPW